MSPNLVCPGEAVSASLSPGPAPAQAGTGEIIIAAMFLVTAQRAFGDPGWDAMQPGAPGTCNL